MHEKKGNFNSHAHVERDMIDLIINRRFRHFNSHAHVERDLCQGILSEFLQNFNSHAHVERDRKNSQLFQK